MVIGFVSIIIIIAAYETSIFWGQVKSGEAELCFFQSLQFKDIAFIGSVLTFSNLLRCLFEIFNIFHLMDSIGHFFLIRHFLKTQINQNPIFMNWTLNSIVIDGTWSESVHLGSLWLNTDKRKFKKTQAIMLVDVETLSMSKIYLLKSCRHR